MNPDPSVQSSTQGTIPVPLQKALSSLDISLESELARYRRLRPRQPQPGSRRNLNSQQLQPLELFESGRTPPTTSADAEPVTKKVLPPLEFAASDETTATSSLVHRPTTPEAEVETPELPAPEVYFQSSEELLRSLKTEPQKKAKVVNSLFTPLGIGSMLVLLVASVLLGSTLLDSEDLNRLGLGRLISSQHTPENREATDVQVAPVNSPEPEIPQYPNLANQEFVDLNLDTLSTLPLEPQQTEPTEATQPPAATETTQPQPTPTEAPASTGAESNLTAALLPPALRPQAVVPTESSPETASGDSEDLEAAPAPTNQNFYFVMVDYTGANSLANAREIEKEAYLVQLPQGVHIQMGAFPQASLAQAFVKELQEKGLAANVYRPQ